VEPNGIIRGIATADLHLGIDNVGGVNAYGLPARVDDYFDALDQIIGMAFREGADLFIIAGDLTRHRNPPQRIAAPFLYRVRALIDKGITPVLVRGNHDGDSGNGQSNLLDTAEVLGAFVFNEPASMTVTLAGDRKVRLVGIPWPRLGRADARDLDELTNAADAAVRQTIVRAVLPPDMDEGPQVLIGHLAVAGADRASDQWMTLGYEPLVRASDFPVTLDLVLLGHYHKPGVIKGGSTLAVYCGSPITIDFGEEGQEKVAWRFVLNPREPAGARCVDLTPFTVRGRPFQTIDLDLADLIAPDLVTVAAIDAIRQAGVAEGAVVRLRITCRAAAQAGALDLGRIGTVLRDTAAWDVAGITVDAPRAERRWGGDGLTGRPPEEILREYLERTEADPERRTRLYGLAMGLKGEA
jgi:exonuclease SbcD